MKLISIHFPKMILRTAKGWDEIKDSDQKIGAGILYNFNKRSAISVEMFSSKLFDTSLKIGYLINF